MNDHIKEIEKGFNGNKFLTLRHLVLHHDNRDEVVDYLEMYNGKVARRFARLSGKKIPEVNCEYKGIVRNFIDVIW